MAKIKDSDPKNSSGGYLRLVGDSNVADLLTKAHSANIRNGNELEQIVFSKVPASQNIKDLDFFIEECRNGNIENGNYLCEKKVIEKSKYKLSKHQPDLLIFIINDNKICYIIELKDGDDFDTKKSQSEKDSLLAFKNHLESKLGDLFNSIDYKICCFNQEDKTKIVAGLKKKFTIDEVINGRELCDLLKINYNTIVNERKKDAEDNFLYIVDEVSKIDKVKEVVNTNQKKIVVKNDFYHNENDDEDS